MREYYESPRPKKLTREERLLRLGPSGLVDRIVDLGEQVTELEKNMNEASSLLEREYGLTVEEVLSRREEASRLDSEEKQSDETSVN